MAQYRTAYIVAPQPGSEIAERYGKFVVVMREEARAGAAQKLQDAKRRFLLEAGGAEDDTGDEPEWSLPNFDRFWTIEEAEDIFLDTEEEQE